MASVPYRPEVDGLRAVAVLPVIAFHAGASFVPAGYLGVDVFFVISGFLITSLIVAEHSAGTFTLRNFWERRARRILPLLTVVILACLPAAWFLLAVQDAEDFAQSLVAVGVFASNVLFWIEGSYFSPSSEFKPLMHTWSLAVEEQFYVAFPIACLIALKWGRTALFWLLLLAGLASLGAFLVIGPRDPMLSFYLLPARAWQLLMGSLCAMAIYRGLPALPRAANQTLALAGLIAIAGVMVLGPRYFGGFFVAPVIVSLGACAIILCANAQTLAGKALSLRPMVAIGLISYGAYLWHVPLLVFARHALSLTGDPQLERAVHLPWALALGLCAISLVLAAITWRWVEQPFRNRHTISLRRLIIGGVGAWSIFLIFAAILFLTNIQQRFHLTLVRGYDAVQTGIFLDKINDTNIQPWTVITRDNGACVFGSRTLDSTTLERIEDCADRLGPGILLTGDSHAENLHNVVSHLTTKDDFFVTLAQPGCRIIDGWCIQKQIKAQLGDGLGQHFATIAYKEIGSRAILDSNGVSDSQLAFADPTSATISGEHIKCTLAKLAEIAADFDGNTVMIGPFLEPRLNIRRAQPLHSGWAPSPTTRALFEQVDRQFVSAAQAAGLGYVSLIGLSLAPNDTILHQGCMIYRDRDHLSSCGEERMARIMTRTNHALVQLIEDAR